MTIRAKAIALIKNGNKFLFTICKELSTGLTYYIPVGGGINFGECSIDAIKREFMEEAGLELINLELVDVSENIFSFNNVIEHEIVFAYKADLSDKKAYTQNLAGKLNDKGIQINLTWASLEEIQKSSIQLYPSSLNEILNKLK